MRRGRMTTTEQIKVLCVRMGISVAELAREIGQLLQNFNAKLKRDIIFETDYYRFNVGKTDATAHKDLVFIIRVDTQNERKSS